jgi:hypothetical protein
MSGTPSAIRSGITSSSPASRVSARPASAAKALVSDHLGDPGPVQRCALGRQHLGDLVDGMPGRPQLDDPRPGGVLGRGGLRPALAGGEEVPGPGAEVPHRRQQRGGGVAEPGGGLGCWQALGEVGAQRLVPAVRRAVRVQEELPAGPGGLLRGIR